MADRPTNEKTGKPNAAPGAGSLEVLSQRVAALEAQGERYPANANEALTQRIIAMESQIQRERKRYWRNMGLFLGLFLLILAVVVIVSMAFIDSDLVLQMQDANASTQRNVDYLHFVIPILITVAAFFLAFLGMNRLKDIDGQIERIRENLHQEMAQEKDQLADFRSELSESIRFEKQEMQTHRRTASEAIDQKIAARTNAFTDSLRQELEEEQQALLNDLILQQDQGLKEIVTVSQSILGKLSDFEGSYDWLLSGANRQDADALLRSIASLSDAEQRILSLYAMDPRPQNLPELVKQIIETVSSRKLQGDSEDYRSLVAVLAERSLYREACLVCETGADYFPADVDLLGDWVQYGTRIGDYTHVEQALAKLEKLPRSVWTWRTFDLTVAFFLTTGKLKEAERAAQEYITWLPNEERAYYCLARVNRLRYGKQEGLQREIAALRRALDLKLNCPMCADRLAVVLREAGHLNEALVAANRAVKELAQDAPSVDFAQVFYHRALICDRLFYQLVSGGSQDTAWKYAQSAYDNYTTAIESQRLSPAATKQAETRRELLAKYLPE